MGNTEQIDVRLLGAQKEERDEEAENLPEETMAVNFSNMGKEIASNKINPKRSTQRHIIINAAKDREF